jgi:hypothetical protein
LPIIKNEKRPAEAGLSFRMNAESRVAFRN